MSVTERLQVLQRTTPMPLAGHRRGALVPFIVLALPTLLPAAVFYLFPVPSISTGMLIACLMILGLTAIGGLKISKYFQKSRFISIIALAIVLIALHLFVASLFVDAQFDRALQSLAFLALVFVSTAPISSVLRDYSSSIDRAAEWMRIVLLAMALFGLARIQPQQYGVAISGEKSFSVRRTLTFCADIYPFPFARLCSLSRLVALRLAWNSFSDDLLIAKPFPRLRYNSCRSHLFTGFTNGTAGCRCRNANSNPQY